MGHRRNAKVRRNGLVGQHSVFIDRPLGILHRCPNLTSIYCYQCIISVLNVKVLVGPFNQEKVLVGAFSVIVKLHVIFSKGRSQLQFTCHSQHLLPFHSTRHVSSLNIYNSTHSLYYYLQILKCLYDGKKYTRYYYDMTVFCVFKSNSGSSSAEFSISRNLY